jgi:2'-5' RNA ligase
MRKNKPKFVKERPPDQHAVGTDQRLFIGIPIPTDVQAKVAEISAALEERGWPVRWVAAESAHLTLHFIGNTAPERAELLRMGLSSAVAKVAPFRLSTADLGVFPDFRKPRVLWLGLRGQTDHLAELHRAVGAQLIKLGFEADMTRFHPHITLGRVRDNPPATLGADVGRAFNDASIAELVVDQPRVFEVSEALLMRSYLERGGSRHVPVARYPLRGE